MGNAVHKILTVETARRVVVTAIALKRHQLKHGKLPDKLTELTPDFLASVPIDPMDGQPLRYKPNPDGSFLLYSVGEDGKDDGGNPARTPGSHSVTITADWLHPELIDWVWPQPATTTEIKTYNEGQAKRMK
jgi:hypothetical protein